MSGRIEYLSLFTRALGPLRITGLLPFEKGKFSTRNHTGAFLEEFPGCGALYK